MHELYARFEKQLITVLKPVMNNESKRRRGNMSARDLAHIVALATRGLKASSTSLAELRRMTDGLITMMVATVASQRLTSR